MKEELLDNAEKLLNNSKQYAQLANIFKMHKDCQKVLAVVSKTKIDYVLEKYEATIKDKVAKSGSQLVYVTRKEFTEHTPSVATTETAEVENSNFAKAEEVEPTEKEDYSDNPFAYEEPLQEEFFEPLPLVSEKTKDVLLESKPKKSK